MTSPYRMVFERAGCRRICVMLNFYFSQTQMLTFISLHPNFFLSAIGLSGLLIGLLLNQIVYHLPAALQRQWQNESREFLNSIPTTITQSKKKNITLQILCAILSMIVVMHFGLQWQTPAALIFTWGLLGLSFIDLDHTLLPDHLIFPLLWLGLLISLPALFVSSADAIIGAVAGYSGLFLLNAIFFRITGKIGMGHGDFKLCALMGAWMGWKLLPLILLLSAVAGLVVGCIWLALRKKSIHTPLPFGPYLACAGLVVLFYFFN